MIVEDCCVRYGVLNRRPTLFPTTRYLYKIVHAYKGEVDVAVMKDVRDYQAAERERQSRMKSTRNPNDLLQVYEVMQAVNGSDVIYSFWKSHIPFFKSFPDSFVYAWPFVPFAVFPRPSRRFRTACARVSRTFSVSSQPMHASVMLTPYLRPAFPSFGTFCAPSLSQHLRPSCDLMEQTFVDIGFDHHTHDALFTSLDLRR